MTFLGVQRLTPHAFQVTQLTMPCAVWQDEIWQELHGITWLHSRHLPHKPCNGANKFAHCLFKPEFPKFICMALCPWEAGECPRQPQAIKHRWMHNERVTRRWRPMHKPSKCDVPKKTWRE